MSAKKLASLTHIVFVRHSLDVGAQFQAFRPRSGDVLAFYIMIFLSFCDTPLLFACCSALLNAFPCYSILFRNVP